jgi:hypothetical protein
MESSPSGTPPPPLWIIWGGFVMSLASCVGVGAVLLGNQPAAAELIMTLTPIFGGVALFNLAVVVAAPRLFSGRMQFQPYALIRWALCEAVGMYGFVLRALGAPLEVMGAFAGVAFVGMLLTAPTQSARESFERV